MQWDSILALVGFITLITFLAVPFLRRTMFGEFSKEEIKEIFTAWRYIFLFNWGLLDLTSYERFHFYVHGR